MGAGDWHCGNPECKNHTGNVVFGSKTSCPICGMEKPAVGMLPPPVPSMTPRMGMQAAPGGKGSRPGDWNCPNGQCKNHMGNVVYGSKESCPLCGTQKPIDGTGIVGIRPGDWHCSNISCKNNSGSNIVYADKTSCPICLTPKGDQYTEPMRERSRSPFGQFRIS